MIVIVGAVGVLPVTQIQMPVNCTAGEVCPRFGVNWLRFALAGSDVLKCASIRKMQKSPNAGAL